MIFMNYGIIILQPTSPLRKISTIKNFAKICCSKNLNHALSVSKIDHNISIENRNKKFNETCGSWIHEP